MASKLSTLCYIEKEGKYLMLHRTVKEHDVNKDKWIGVGGHFENQESPEECLLREVWEETGYHLTSFVYRGIVTFVYGEDVTEYMSLYTADGFEGEPHDCDEGVLEWVDKAEVLNLNIWEGDKIFFRLLDENIPFFSLKLVYNQNDVLQYAALNGKPMELFDVRNPDGTKTGVVRERGVAHRDGSPHATSHIWVIRKNEDGKYDILLQKRSACKDSNPGCYDISSAGHVAAGDDYLPSAVRELEEELGIKTSKDKLHFVGFHQGGFRDVFHGKPFADYEISAVYTYEETVRIEELTLQKTEVEEVIWMELEDCRKKILCGELKNCIYLDELDLLEEYLAEQKN